MSNLTFIVPELRKHGPALEIVISEKQVSLASGTPDPGGIPLRAMFDTGTRRTIIQLGLPERLGIEPIGNRSVSTASARRHPCFVYALRIAIPSMNLVFEGPSSKCRWRGRMSNALLDATSWRTAS